MATNDTPATDLMADRLLRRPEVEEITCMSTSRLYAAMREGRFPLPKRIGPGSNGAVAWRLSDIQKWLADLPDAKHQHAGES